VVAGQRIISTCQSRACRTERFARRGRDLSAARLIEAYKGGIFPWFNPGQPILWWSPDPRMVLIPDELKVSRSLAKALRNRDYEVRATRTFVT
jgi:leucyl/phenylalanyl-tRNA--protein transferase